MDDAEKGKFERLKLEVDVVKHLSTLDTGTIVFIATVLEKFPRSPLGMHAITVSLGCLLSSLQICVLSWLDPGVNQHKLHLCATRVNFSSCSLHLDSWWE